MLRIRWKKHVIGKCLFIPLVCFGILRWIFYGKTIKDHQDFFIDTPGCSIPNYMQSMKYQEHTDLGIRCGQRVVHIDHVSDHEIIFRIDHEKLKQLAFNMSCGFTTLSNLEGDTIGILSRLEPFTDGTVVRLPNETSVFVVCSDIPPTELKYATDLPTSVYVDFYVILKKIPKIKEIEKRIARPSEKWNVLLLGMESMSRGRMYHSMPKLMEYFKQENWLDYRAYQKVSNNFNILSLLTGMQFVNFNCKPIEKCTNLFMTNKFRNSGYKTCLGEDIHVTPRNGITYLMSHHNFTDHYLRILSDKQKGNLKCFGEISTGHHLLNYAQQFVEAYKNEDFFGLFWSSSFSGNENNGIPTLFQDAVLSFFQRISSEGVMNKTFVLFFGDQGLTSGPAMFTREGYYDSRLPALFLWAPHKFRKSFPDKYNNLIANQNRFVTQYDVHVFLEQILKLSDKKANVKPVAAYRTCKSLFQNISPQRTCSDANIDASACSCHNMTEPGDDEGSKQSLFVALSEITSRMADVQTLQPNTACKPLHFSKVLRNHSFKQGDSTYYVTAGIFGSADVVFESIVERSGTEYRLKSLRSLTEFLKRSNCIAMLSPAKEFCVCVDVSPNG